MGAKIRNKYIEIENIQIIRMNMPFISSSEAKNARPLVKRAYQKKLHSYFSTKTYVVGTQKNRLNETVHLSCQNICSNIFTLLC